ncbi:MAG: hypothetical protein ABH808_00890 [Candidatus Kuenenbacteria bacterium]
MLDDQKKEKWAKLREIILNIIGEKENNSQEKEKIIKNKKEVEKNKLSVKLPLAFFNKINKQKLFHSFIWQKNKKNICVALMIFIFLIIGFLVILGIGLYKYHWDSEEIIKITNIISYPAIIINNKETNNYKIIKYSEFQENFKSIKFFFQKQKQIDSNFQILSDKILKENTLEMMIEDYFISETFQKNRIVIKKEEIDNKVQEIINQVGSEEHLKKIIKNLYNWDLNKFKNKAIKQIISQEKIEKLIAPEDLREWLKEQYKKVKIYKFI